MPRKPRSIVCVDCSKTFETANYLTAKRCKKCAGSISLRTARDIRWRANRLRLKKDIKRGFKLCRICGEDKPISEFNFRVSQVGYNARYSAANSNALRFHACRECRVLGNYITGLKKTYNLTYEDYTDILESQGGGCAICFSTPKNRRLNVDHDHKTGLIRGLLCMRCNRGLAYFKDDPELFLRSHRYLSSPPAVLILDREVFGIVGRIRKRSRRRRK